MTQMFGDSLSKILGLILIVVVLPIFAGLGMLSAEQFSMTVLCITASAGIVSMGDIITQFMPIFGIGAESNYPSRFLKTSSMKRKTNQLSQWISACASFSLLAGFGLLRRAG